LKILTLGLLIGAICLLGGASALAYNEAPMLRVKVAAGELPSVEERLPDEPTVVKVVEEIGQYGGTLNVFAMDQTPWNDMTEGPERAGYLAVFTEDATIVGHLAKALELSEDQKSLTIYLREGTKWSDGPPFTVEDIVFMFEALHWNDNVETWNDMPEVTRLKIIDDYTVRLEADEPSPLMLPKMVTFIGSHWFMFHPKHYLEKWHIDYNPNANELAEEEGCDSWWECFHYHYWWATLQDLNLPTLQAWIMKESTATYKVFERNPYYWAVDPAGNQLPYIDRIVSHIVSPEVYQMKVISGEADVAFCGTSVSNYSLYKENEESGGYRVISIPGGGGADVGFGVNQNHSDPAIRKIYQDVRFRRALSLAINREEINEVSFFGMAVPRQATVLPSASYYKEEWGEAYAQYDPDKANSLLDEVGLTERDRDGFRIGPDGKALSLIIDVIAQWAEENMSSLELVTEYWGDIGVKVVVKPEEAGLWEERRDDPDHSIFGAPLEDAEEVTNYTERADAWDPGDSADMAWSPLWSVWFQAKREIAVGRKTLQDFAGGKLPGEEPPAEIKELGEWIEQRNRVEIGSEEYTELSQKIFDFHAEEVFMIGTVGMAPTLYIAKNNLGNVPEVYDIGYYDIALSSYGRQLFWKQ